MNIRLCLYLLIPLISPIHYAQKVGINTSTPDGSALLDINASIRKGGLKIPSIALQSTADVTTIPNPAVGLLVFNTQTTTNGNNDVTSNYLYYYTGTEWKKITSRTDFKNNNPELPYIVAFGKKDNRTVCNSTVSVSGNFELTTVSNPALISPTGQLTAPQNGYYYFSVLNSFRIGANASQDFNESPYIGADNLTIHTSRFRGNGSSVSIQFSTSTGVVYLDKDQQTSPFYWNLGTGNACVTVPIGSVIPDDQKYVGNQLVVWEYIGI